MVEQYNREYELERTNERIEALADTMQEKFADVPDTLSLIPPQYSFDEKNNVSKQEKSQ